MKKLILGCLAAMFLVLFGKPVLSASFPDVEGLDNAVKDEAVEELTKNTLSTLKIKAKMGQVFFIPPKQNDPDPAATSADKERGFIPFKRIYNEVLWYNSKPVEAERSVDSLKFFATPGEYEPLTLALYPLEEGTATVSFSDLKSPEGGTILSKNISARWVKHMVRGEYASTILHVYPEMLIESGNVPLKPGVTRQIWGILKVPEDAKAGKYTGSLTVKLPGKKEGVFELALEVLPFKLKEDPEFTFAWYVGPRTKEEMLDYRAHGCTGLDTGTGPKFVTVVGTDVQLDWTEAEKTFKLAKETGLTGHHKTLVIFLANELICAGKFEEFSPEYNKAYKNMLTQMQKWYTDHGLTMAFWLVDEPRESALQTFHRNLVNTTKYIKLANEVPGLRSMIDPTGDIDPTTSIDYTSLADILKVVDTHSWDGSEKLINKAKKNKAELVLYNCDRLRISYGFNSWKLGANGRWEWGHTEWDMTKAREFQVVTSWHTATPSGVIYKDEKGAIISTPAWEIAREGADDYRYIYTLEKAIADSEKSNPDGAKKAKAVLDSIKAKIPLYVSGLKEAQKVAAENTAAERKLDEWRYQIAQEIVKLGK